MKAKVKTAIQGVTPGVQVLAYHKGKKAISLDVGETYSFYDWASLTKVVSTISLCMKLVDSKKIDINHSVKNYLPWLSLENPVQEFMTHSAGMTWWVPLYKSIPTDIDLAERRYHLMKILRDFKSEKVEKAVYSDIDFWILGLLIEALESHPLDTLFDVLADQLRLKNTFYHRENKPRYRVEKYAPTEQCEWRGRIMQGEVHDENAWALGGVAGHAGLFGPIDDLMAWGLEIRRALRGESRVWSQKTTKLFLSRHLEPRVGDWALGFMMPTPGVSSCGKYFSTSSVGHTGFTGTSIWFDPKKDVIVAILSNRVHPTRRNEEFKKLRPQLHDWVMEELNV